MPTDNDGLEQGALTEQQSWSYILRFVAALTGVFGFVAIGVLVYNLHSDGVVSEGEELLASQPSADHLKRAFELLSESHIFGGWKAPKHLLVPTDPTLGSLDEEALADAAKNAADFPLPNSQPKTVGQCGNDHLCIIGALGTLPKKARKKKKPRRAALSLQVYRYLELRRRMAHGTPISPELLTFLRSHVTLWVRAFEREVLNGQGQTSSADVVMLNSLLESRRGSTETTWVFIWYSVVATLMMALLLFLWWRYRRPATTNEAASSTASPPQ